jgi:hypothetical protein
MLSVQVASWSWFRCIWRVTLLWRRTVGENSRSTGVFKILEMIGRHEVEQLKLTISI